jgi:hypothetical protein
MQSVVIIAGGNKLQNVLGYSCIPELANYLPGSGYRFRRRFEYDCISRGKGGADSSHWYCIREIPRRHDEDNTKWL